MGAEMKKTPLKTKYGAYELFAFGSCIDGDDVMVCGRNRPALRRVWNKIHPYTTPLDMKGVIRVVISQPKNENDRRTR